MAIPDADIHTSATGRAAKIVAAHQDPAPLTLYSGWFCPFVQRVWSVLEEKGIPYQYVEVNPYHKPESLLKINPRGLVPTLEYEGKPLYESSVVLEFIEDVYGDTGKRLRSEDPVERARGRIWADFVSSRINPSYHRFLQHQPSSDREGLATKQQEFLSHLKTFTKEMDSTGPFFFGSQPSLVDFTLAPWALRIWVFDHFKGGSGIPAEGEGGKDEQVWDRWRKWVKAMEERSSMRDTMSEREHYMPIYQRYADDTAMSEAAKAIRAGKGIP